MKKLNFILIITVSVLAVIVWASSGGPPNGVTGAPGEGTCANCHGNLNTGSGSVGLTLPGEYTPGDTVSVAIALQQTGQQRWGFEITVLNYINMPAGNLMVTDAARTQLSIAGNGRQYVKHTSTGTDNGVLNVAPGWSLKWASPASPAGPVTFYVAGNAANGNGSSSGDFIYTTSQVLPQAGCLAVPGDANASGDLSLGDIIATVNYIFNKPGWPTCGSNSNLCWLSDLMCRGDWSGDGMVTLSDVIRGVNYLFSKPGGPWNPVPVSSCCQPVP
jgi:hypothetical protein